MESSRRPPFDRSREPGLKKPRLAEAQDPRLNPNGRPFSQRPSPLTASRYRASDNSSDSSRGEAYQPHPPQQPFQELVSQYKTALAELTFNSKPIITNLTIIAGENLHAAKAIAATVCTNILEVPSDQKLPSLYLLDSIVKNIGRDYIKYFAPKLPEVFCKAYRQVDPTIHRSMRHLFGTWKGVFPPQALQAIEKELGFAPAINGASSGATASRPDSQSQRPAHSIHVNPKILERQRLQQSNRDIQLSNKDALTETVHRKNFGAAYGDDEYGGDIPRNLGLGSGRTSGRVAEHGHDKPLYGAGIGVSETLSNQRNGFNDKHGFTKYSSTRSANVDTHLPPAQSIASRSRGGMSSSWKDTEEEEFMWDSGSTVPGAADNSNLRKGHWTPDDSGKLGSVSHLRKSYNVAHVAHEPASRFDSEPSSESLSAEQKDQEVFGNRTSSSWSLQDTQSGYSAIYTASSGDLPASTNLPLHKVGANLHSGSSHSVVSSFGLSANVPGPVRSVRQQKTHLNQDASSLGLSSVHRRPPAPSVPLRHSHQQYPGLADQNQPNSLSRPDIGGARYLAQLDIGSHSQFPRGSSDLPSNFEAENFPKLRSEDLRESSSQIRQHYPSMLPPESSTDQDQNTPKPPVSNLATSSILVNSESDNSDSFTTENAGQLNTSTLLSAVVKSGILPKTSLQSGVQPPLPSGHPPAQAVPSLPVASPLSLPVSASLGNTSALLSISSVKAEQPPLPLGPHPSVARVSSVSTQPATTVNTENQLSNLLSSLVAQGLISASETKSASSSPSEVASQLQKRGAEIVGTKSEPVSSSPSSSAIPCASAMDEVSSADTAPKKSALLVQSSTAELKNLIGLEFRSDFLREFHSSVIHELFDDFPLACGICGLRLKLQEQHGRHLQWHASKGSVSDGSKTGSRQWFTNMADWISGKTQISSALQSECSIEKSGKSVDDAGPMVPADETQCVCILCGEVFEDFYSQERDEWMFRGAVLMNKSGIGETGTSSLSPTHGPIVHANCVSETSMHDLGLARDVKMENV